MRTLHPRRRRDPGWSALTAAAIFVASLPSAGRSGPPRMLASVDVPGNAPVLSMSVSANTVYLGVAEHGGGELHVIDASVPGNPTLTDSIEIGSAVRRVRRLGGRLYLATDDDTKEVRILDAATHAELGVVDLPGVRRAEAVMPFDYGGKIMVVALATVDPNALRRFTVDATDPAKTILLGQGAGRLPPRPPAAMPPYDAGGPIVARERGATDPALTLLAVDRTDAELQIVADLNDALSIPDANGDGVVRVACLGDSNTAETGRSLSWCSLARREIWHPALRLLSGYARAGARMVPRPGAAIPGAEAQLESAIAGGADHVILAFGTNDVATPARVIADTALRAKRRADAAGIGMWVALVPPRGPNAETGEIDAMNAALRAAFAPTDLIDFSTGFTFADTRADRIHFTPAGQAKRARVVAKRLRRGHGATDERGR